MNRRAPRSTSRTPYPELPTVISRNGFPLYNRSICGNSKSPPIFTLPVFPLPLLPFPLVNRGDLCYYSVRRYIALHNR